MKGYLEKRRRHLRDVINYLKKPFEWETHMTISTDDNEKRRVIVI